MHNPTGYSVNHLDIAPKYAGILMGLTNGLANISGFICPALIEYLTKAYVFIKLLFCYHKFLYQSTQIFRVHWDGG